MRTLNFDVLTLFPGMLEGPLNESILKRGREKGLLNIAVRNIRDHTEDKHKTADDSPYGGGAGMVLKPGPIFSAVKALKAEHPNETFLTILLSPQGRLFDQQRAEELSEEKRRIILLCGHYEAIDERVIDALVDEELSIGDYVLTGGELAALVVIDAAARLLPGVLGDEESAYRDSFGDGRLHPCLCGWSISVQHCLINGFELVHSILLCWFIRPQVATQLIASRTSIGSYCGLL